MTLARSSVPGSTTFRIFFPFISTNAPGACRSKDIILRDLHFHFTRN